MGIVFYLVYARWDDIKAYWTDGEEAKPAKKENSVGPVND